jgi:hypothetical protein
VNAAVRYLGQFAAYALFAALIGYFAQAPDYVYRPADGAEIKLSFSHGGQKKGGCRQLTAEEIAKLPPNMRRTQSCPRERVPVVIEMDVGGLVSYREVLPPSGLAGDGPSRAYRRFNLPPGRHRVALRLRDSERTVGFDYERVVEFDLRARQNFVVDFRPEAGGFVIR